MIDDAKIRLQILKNVPALEPWRVEMEEIEFGEYIGIFLKLPTGVQRLRTRSWSNAGRDAPKSEGRIAFELSQQIKAAMASTPDAPMTVVNNKIVRDENGSRGASSA